MTRIVQIFVLLSTVAIAGMVSASETRSSIRGQINFTGNIPAPEAHKIGGDRFCEEVNSRKPIMRDELIISPERTISNVVVWISKGGPDDFYKSDGKSRPPVVLQQRDCSFSPHVVALQKGQELIVQNADKTLHNINAQPSINPRLNKAVIPGGKPVSITFEKPEVAVKLKSDIHPWMTAWAAVFDHSAFAVTGEDGRFEIKDVPPGEYILQAWQEKFGSVSMQVLVMAEQPANVIFTYTNHGSKGGAQVDAQGNPTTGTLQRTLD